MEDQVAEMEIGLDNTILGFLISAWLALCLYPSMTPLRETVSPSNCCSDLGSSDLQEVFLHWPAAARTNVLREIATAASTQVGTSILNPESRQC